MEHISKALLYLHISAGFISLVLFWIPMFAKKGGGLHNRVGIVYVNAMWIVVITAFILSLQNLFQGEYVIAGFLGFLSVLTSAPLWYAKAILKNKKELSPQYFLIFRSLHGIIFLSGLLLITWSLILRVQGPAVLMLIFGILGVANYRRVFVTLPELKDAKSWLVTHLNGMISSGIAAYTAFFAFGSRQFMGELLSGYLTVVPWVLPTILGTIAIRYYTKKYQPKAVNRSHALAKK